MLKMILLTHSAQFSSHNETAHDNLIYPSDTDDGDMCSPGSFRSLEDAPLRVFAEVFLTPKQGQNKSLKALQFQILFKYLHLTWSPFNICQSFWHFPVFSLWQHDCESP